MAYSDPAYDEVNALLDKLERQLSREYELAAAQMQKKAREYFDKFTAQDKKQRALLEAGEITQKEYADWRRRVMLNGSHWSNMRDTLAQDATNADMIAMSIVKQYMPEAYAIGHNYGTYEIEHGTALDTSYTLYDRATVERLWRENPKLLPDPAPNSKTARKLKENKDLRWNSQHIQSAVTQGILQGKPLNDVAMSLMQITDMDYNAAKRNAGTMMTSSQNGGRIDSYERAESMGIEVKKTWIATLDGHTRSSHIYLDGQTRDIDEPFESELGELMFPGDPNGEPSDVYNCFIGETNIASDSKIIRGYKHQYDGELITVKTATGVSFTCTPNHPILTDRGWVGAQFLNKSDNIIVTLGRYGKFSRTYPHINHIHSRIDTIFKSVEVMGIKRTCRLGVNFHSDIPTTDVEIVTQKRFLRNNGNARVNESSNKLVFKSSNKTFMCKSAFVKHIGSIFSSLLCFVCGFGKLFSFFLSSLRHSEIHSLRPIALLNACGMKPLNNDVTGTAKLVGECLNGFSGIVFSDNITSVNRSISNCHVYNLQTENGYYFANNIIAKTGENKVKTERKYTDIYAIVHNCRCTLISQIKGFERDPSDLGLRHDEALASMTYEEWKGEHIEQEQAPQTAQTVDNSPKPLENPTIDDIDDKIKEWETFSDNSLSLDDWAKAEEEIQKLTEQKKQLILEEVQRKENEQKEIIKNRMIEKGFFDNGEAFVAQYNFDDVSAENLATIEKAYDKVFERYPQLKGKFAGIDLWDSDNPDNAAAETDMQGGLISFNPRYWKTNKVVETAKEQFEKGKLAVNSPEGLAMHEIGHAIDSLTKNRWDIAENRVKVYSGNIKTTSENGYFMRKVYHQAGVDKAELSKYISLYGTYNDEEAFAECFGAYMTGSKRNVVIDTFGKLFEELMEGWK